MESSGEPGRVHLSRRAAYYVQQQSPNRLALGLTRRGPTAVKGAQLEGEDKNDRRGEGGP